MLAIIEAVDNDKDRNLLERWYNEYNRIMKKRAYEILNSYDLAEDMLHDAFVKIIKNLETIKQIAEYKRPYYFIRTMESVCYDYLKKQNREDNVIDKNFDRDKIEQNIGKGLNPEQVYANKDFFKKIVKCLDKISELDRELIIGIFVYGLSYKELGEKLNIKEQNVNSYVRRARKRLIKLIDEEA